MLVKENRVLGVLPVRQYTREDFLLCTLGDNNISQYPVLEPIAMNRYFNLIWLRFY